MVIGPYSYLAGAMALDFGGKQAAATSSGIIDGVGYLGGVLSGDAVARLSLAAGWQGAFATLGTVAALSTLTAASSSLFNAAAVFPPHSGNTGGRNPTRGHALRPPIKNRNQAIFRHDIKQNAGRSGPWKAGALTKAPDTFLPAEE